MHRNNSNSNSKTHLVLDPLPLFFKGLSLLSQLIPLQRQFPSHHFPLVLDLFAFLGDLPARVLAFHGHLLDGVRDLGLALPLVHLQLLVPDIEWKKFFCKVDRPRAFNV